MLTGGPVQAATVMVRAGMKAWTALEGDMVICEVDLD